jgi:asparagine synthase (glutamine-hydrolysing)
MPGIVGLITQKSHEDAEDELKRMVKTLCHESFYVSGTFIDRSLGLYVGWVARRGSFADGMPLQSETGNKILIFSGEDFCEEGSAHIHNMCEKTNDPYENSYLIDLAEGASFPACLNGQFHGLLIDKAASTAMLFNDRFGLHRIYFHQAKDGFYFSAEAKAILAVRPELRSTDMQGMSEYVAYGCALGDRSLFAQISLLPRASAWVFRNGRVETKHSYFSPQEWESQTPLEPEIYYREVKETFARILPRYFKGQVGLSLTGGLDTRTILAWGNPSPGTLPCYTFAGMLGESRDVSIALRVAKLCQQSCQEIRADRAFLSQFSYYAQRMMYLTDGCGGVSQTPDLYLNELARSIAPIRLTGNYGDQVLRQQSVMHYSAPTAEIFAPDFDAMIAQAQKTYDQIKLNHALSVAGFQQMSWNYYGMRAIEETQLDMRTPYIDNDLLRVLYRAPVSVLGNNDLRVRLIGDGNSRLRSIRSDLGFAGRGGKLAERLSSKYHRFTQRCEWAYDIGMPQWLAGVDHHLSALHLERLFIGRHKFSHFRLWYRNELAAYVQEMLLDSRTLSRPYLNANSVRMIVERHLKGDRNYTAAIHKILALEYVHRLFID